MLRSDRRGRQTVLANPVIFLRLDNNLNTIKNYYFWQEPISEIIKPRSDDDGDDDASSDSEGEVSQVILPFFLYCLLARV